MIDLTLAEIAAATGGTLDGAADPQARVTGDVRIDSRLAGPGDLFVALPGEHADGHDHAPEALAAGALAVLAARPIGGPAVLVDDPLHALGLLARVVRDRLPAMVTGVTGSSGKTSTKDLLAAVMAAAGPSHAPQGSFNNELGVPLTILGAPAQTRFLVLEMGSRGIGHIAYLCGIARPDVGIVLNVGAAHAGEFGGREQTALAKGELVEALDESGLAVLNADDPLVAAMAARTKARVVLTSSTEPPAPSATVVATGIVTDGQARASFRLVTPAGSADIALQVIGVHQVANALAAAAAGLEAGLTPQQIADALSGAVAASRWRMEIVQRGDGLVIVNDAYNANPDSMAAALAAVAVMGRNGRKIAVLGEMLELGDEAEAGHTEVGRLAASLGIDVLAVGPGAAHIAAGAAEVHGTNNARARAVPSWEDAVEMIEDQCGPGDVVLVKASRGVGLERVVDALLAMDSGIDTVRAARVPHG